MAPESSIPIADRCPAQASSLPLERAPRIKFSYTPHALNAPPVVEQDRANKSQPGYGPTRNRAQTSHKPHHPPPRRWAHIHYRDPRLFPESHVLADPHCLNLQFHPGTHDNRT